MQTNVELTPGIMGALPYAEIVWVGHRFDGKFGSCDTAAWVRNATGLVSWKSDPVCNRVYNHPDCMWLHRDGSNGAVSWFVSKYFASETPQQHIYSLTKIRPLAGPASMSDMHSTWQQVTVGRNPAEGLWNKAKWEVEAWWYGVEREPVWVKTQHLAALQQYLGVRGRNGFVYAGMRAKTLEVLHADAEFQRVQMMFPGYVMDYPDQLANAAFCYGLDRQVERMATLRYDWGATMNEYNFHRGHFDTPQERSWSVSKLVWFVVGSIAFWLGRMALRKIQNWIFGLVVTWLGGLATAAYEDIFDGNVIRPGAVGTVIEWDFILPFFYVLIGAPILEESFKRYTYSWWGNFGSLLLAWGDMGQYKNPSTYLPTMMVIHYCTHVFFHSRPTYKQAVLWHMLWNAKGLYFRMQKKEEIATVAAVVEVEHVVSILLLFCLCYVARWALVKALESKSIAQAVQQFDQHYYRSARYVNVPDDRILHGMLLTTEAVPAYRYSNETITPEFDGDNHLAGKSIKEYERVPLLLRLDSEFPEAEKEREGYWRIWFVNVPMFKPAKCSANFKAILLQRLWKKPKYSYAPKHLMRNWLKLARMFTALPVESDADTFIKIGESWSVTNRVLPQSPLENFEQWLEHTERSKHERYISAFLAIEHNFPEGWMATVQSVQVNIKTDEVLLKTREAWEDKGAVPRPIHAVDPRVSVAIGVALYPVSEQIKVTFDGKTPAITLPWGKIYLTYGAGRTDVFLNEWLSFALENKGIHIIAAGDDSLIVANRDKVVIFEGDLTMMDQTVRTDALEAEFRVLKAFGLAANVIELLRRSCAAACCINAGSRDKGVMTFTRAMQRNTGGVDTTVGNTIVTLMAWTAAMVEELRFGSSKPTEIFADLGLELKLKTFIYDDELFPATFLKGCWITNGQRLVWGPLPSRWIKLSKTINDPRITMRMRGESKLSMVEALNRQFFGTMKGMEVFANPKFMSEKFASIDHPWSRKEDLCEAWKVQGESRERWENSAFFAFCIHRYGFTERDCASYAFVLQCLRPGLVSFNPFWQKLASADYS